MVSETFSRLVVTGHNTGGDPSIPDNNGTLPANLASSFGKYSLWPHDGGVYHVRTRTL